MEDGEGIPDLNEAYAEDASPIRMVPPICVGGELQLGVLPAREESQTAVGRSNIGRKRGRGKQWKGSQRLEAVKPRFANVISERDRANGHSEIVSRLLMWFDAARRRMCQVQSAHGDNKVTADTMKELELYTNKVKRTGGVPGVDVGDMFYCWGEMDIVGLHGARISIDETEGVFNGERASVVISVVDTGKNADTTQDPHSLVFTGYGGTDKFSGQPSDQQLLKLNLKLHNAMRLNACVRVIRSVFDKTRTQGKIYIYDGIYKVTTMWDERNKAGYKVYKFLLVRHPDQKPAFHTWRAIEEWKNHITARPNLLLEDLSYGAENLKVRLVNEVDRDEAPTAFAYLPSLQHVLMDVQLPFSTCTCKRKSCGLRDANCLCTDRNGGEIPYIETGILVTRRPMVYECGGSCRCSVYCKNKIIKTGLKFSFEVFKTRECGWGLSSWDPIRAGSFICEYAGQVVQNADEDDDYVFDTSRLYNSFHWNYIPEVVDEDASARVPEEFTLLEPMMISAKTVGNVARFMNHGCTPNVLWQPISREQGGKLYIHIGFFAIKHIPPLTELRYDYGTSGPEGKKKCMCGSDNCRGSFG